VLIHPYDTSLINDSGDDRRKYINALVSQIDRVYLHNVVKYNKLLADRNRLLKQSFSSGELLEVIDMQLADVGQSIYAQRKEVIEAIAPVVTRYYSELADCGDEVQLSYRSQLNQATMAELLQASRERDRVMQHTTVGIHRDDLSMTFGGRQLRRFGSQGEQKSFLIALKLAQYDVIARNSAVKPILLLDDIFDKLDANRVEQIIKLVASDSFGQIFITDTNREHLDRILRKVDSDYRIFEVEHGVVREMKEGEFV
jgi:DNA replication and repair protein RecF